MEIALYVICGLTSVMGFLTLVTASQYKFAHLGLTLGGLAYVSAGVAAYMTMSWWPVLGGWIAALIIRKIFGDIPK